MPTFILVVDGEERMRLIGQQSEAQLRRLLSQIPNDPKPSVISQPDPRNIAQAAPEAETRVALNEEPAALPVDLYFPVWRETGHSRHNGTARNPGETRPGRKSQGGFGRGKPPGFQRKGADHE